MKITTWFISLILILSGCTSKPVQNSENKDESMATAITYDSALAKKFGADEFGMKHYVMAFLRTGPKRDQDSATAARLLRAHLDNIFRLADEGKLAVAGPFLDESDLQGIFIFNVSTVEEARALVETDPAVQAGRFEMELHPWYGSAALMQVNDLHKKIQKEKI
jgi:uncharacterized protein